MSKNTKDFFKKKKEWSKVKDEILACYLKPYFTKIQYTKKKIIYIDGFAGVGIFEDGTLGSTLIAYNIAIKKIYNRCADYVENFCQEKNILVHIKNKTKS